MRDYQAVDGGESKRDQIRRRMEDEFLDAHRPATTSSACRRTRGRGSARTARSAPRRACPCCRWATSSGPQSLEATLRRAWEVTKGEVPLLVTENGIGTDDDDQRIEYVQPALEGVQRAIADGIDVRGYTYWSLLDNFEWAFGYGPRFGLVAVDRTTFERTPKPSARWLGEIAKANAL